MAPSRGAAGYPHKGALQGLYECGPRGELTLARARSPREASAQSGLDSGEASAREASGWTSAFWLSLAWLLVGFRPDCWISFGFRLDCWISAGLLDFGWMSAWISAWLGLDWAWILHLRLLLLGFLIILASHRLS